MELLDHFIKHKPLISEEWYNWWHKLFRIRLLHTSCVGRKFNTLFLLQSPKGNLPTVYHLYGLKGRGKRGENLGRSFGWMVVVKSHKGLSLISFLRKLIGAWVAIYDSRNLNDDHNDFGQNHSVMFWPTQVANAQWSKKIEKCNWGKLRSS